MAYSEALAGRVRASLADQGALDEQKMFGGLAFMLDGNMCCCVSRGGLLVRVGPDGYDDALNAPNAQPMQMGGRTMRGMVLVTPAGLESDDGLVGWVQRALAFVKTLPAK